jgi:GNAT superfamily N-acetyltransferase
MTEPLAPPRELWDDTFDLLNAVLRPGQPPTIREEYPLAFREENMVNSRVVVEDGRVLSHVVFLPIDVHVDGVHIRIGLIGSVATHPEARGRGLATACLAACERGVREAGCSVAVLWADDDAFYVKQGYVRAGREDLFMIPARLLRRRNDRSGVRPAENGDAVALSDLHQTLRSRTIRTPHDWRELLKIPRMRTLVYERDRHIVAYSCCGKGADFEGVVHEWAGPTEEALDLVLEQALRAEREEIVLLSPPYTGRIRRILRERGLPAHRGALGMMKVVDDRGFAEALNRFFEPGTGPAGEVEYLEEGRYRFTTSSGTREIDASELLLQAFGSDQTEDNVVPGLPLPLYLRGLDSV